MIRILSKIAFLDETSAKTETQKPKQRVSKTETETGTYFSTSVKPNQN